MRFIERPIGSFLDRMKNEPDLEPIDVIMPTLDSEVFLEKCLYSVYKEIPVRKLFVCDGGSNDQTIEILKKFPRVEPFVKSDIRTTGKVMEFLMSLVETDWFVQIDSDILLTPGWYDEMRKHKKEFDVMENSKRILAYHFYREDKNKLQPNFRSLDFCHLMKKSAIENFHCDDDYMARFTDYFLRQIVENSGHKYGKISTTQHIHNETERHVYKSDDEKNFEKLVYKEPELIVLDKKKKETSKIKNAKAIVKYLDPNSPLLKNDQRTDILIRVLKRDWIIKNGPAWIERYDRMSPLRLNRNNFLIQAGRKLRRKFF